MSVVDSGKAAECFGKMVAGLGGPADFVENYDNYLEKAEIIKPVYAIESGVVTAMDTRAIGMAGGGEGGGRFATYPKGWWLIRLRNTPNSDWSTGIRLRQA